MLDASGAEADHLRPSYSGIRGVLERAATRNGLPIAVFTRLIWQESRFDAAALSLAAARGVAQFMPSTAVSRGLGDPLEPTASLIESAWYPRDLLQNFLAAYQHVRTTFSRILGRVEIKIARRRVGADTVVPRRLERATRRIVTHSAPSKRNGDYPRAPREQSPTEGSAQNAAAPTAVDKIMETLRDPCRFVLAQVSLARASPLKRTLP